MIGRPEAKQEAAMESTTKPLAYAPDSRSTELAQPHRARNRPLRYWLALILRHGLLIGVSLLFMVPFYWMVISSLKTQTTVFTSPVQWWPSSLQWHNYLEAATYPGFPFLRFMWNSFYYASLVTLGTVLSCAAVGYGFARLRFPGRDALFAITVATLMIPSIVTLIPTFVIFKNLGWIGGYAPLIVPSFFGSAFFIFMMRQFFLGLPKELDDAARVDGASEFRIFWQIMLPLVRPALLVMAVFTFMWTWQEFFGPLVYLQDSEKFPLSLGLFNFRFRRNTEWHLMMAGATLATLPLILMFFVAQRYFLEGIKLTGIKG
jgi:multiple sugar transport system permease protein